MQWPLSQGLPGLENLSLIPGSVGAAVVSSLTHARRSHVNFTTSGGSFLWTCNGTDDALLSRGKVDNDTNKLGEQAPTQLNQGQRTPDSRSDREAHVGGSNQSQSRRGPVGSAKR